MWSENRLRLRRLQYSLHPLHRVSRSANGANDGTARKTCFWRCLIPKFSRLMHRDIVPNDRRTVVFPKQARHEMLFVPVLRDPEVRESPKSGSRRRRQIGWQYRLPNHEYLYSCVVSFTEQSFECRGPLQADCSGR